MKLAESVANRFNGVKPGTVTTTPSQPGAHAVAAVPAVQPAPPPAPLVKPFQRKNDLTHLAQVLVAPKSSFPGDRITTPTGGHLSFVDNGARVLGVAHLDWVGDPDTRKPKKTDPNDEPYWLKGRRWDPQLMQWVDYAHRVVPRYYRPDPPRQKHPLFGSNGNIVRFPSLDDRLGAWGLLQLWQSGLKIDLLFTDDEETGNTTAQFFRDSPRQYNWVFSLDRAGTDVVLYQYDDVKEWKELCDTELPPVKRGSFSCIGKLEHLGACALNLGIGYHEHNGPDCWADLTETRTQLTRFVQFHKRNAMTPYLLPEDFKKPKYGRGNVHYTGYGSRGNGPMGFQGNLGSGGFLGACGYMDVGDAAEQAWPIGKDKDGVYRQGHNQEPAALTHETSAGTPLTAEKIAAVIGSDDVPFLTDGSNGFCDACGKLAKLDVDSGICELCTHELIADIRRRL